MLSPFIIVRPQGGQFVIQLYDAYAVSVTVLAIVALEAVAVAWCYGVGAISSDIKAMVGQKPGVFWIICWQFLSPAAICVSKNPGLLKNQ